MEEIRRVIDEVQRVRDEAVQAVSDKFWEFLTTISQPANDVWVFLTALSQPWATLIGGLIVGFGAYLGFKVSMKSHQREVMFARHNRYTTIAEQLANKHETIRLAGVYALAALSDEWQKAGDYGQRDVAVKLLCAYLRGEPRVNKQDKTLNYKDREVRTAIIFIIRTHTRREGKRKSSIMWAGPLIDLTGADLVGADLSNADLSWAKLSKADLTGADLSSSSLSFAELTGAKLTGANMWHASTFGVDLSQTFGEPSNESVTSRYL